MKLEHLAHYLPYNLKMVCNQDIDDVLYSPINITERFYSMPTAILTNFKPILRPLSDLSKGEFTNNIISQKNRLEIIKLNTCHWLDYYSSQYLFENHFDVFNLIPQKLAIDKNTLDEN